MEISNLLAKEALKLRQVSNCFELEIITDRVWHVKLKGAPHSQYVN